MGISGTACRRIVERREAILGELVEFGVEIRQRQDDGRVLGWSFGKSRPCFRFLVLTIVMLRPTKIALSPLCSTCARTSRAASGRLLARTRLSSSQAVAGRRHGSTTAKITPRTDGLEPHHGEPSRKGSHSYQAHGLRSLRPVPLSPPRWRDRPSRSADGCSRNARLRPTCTSLPCGTAPA